MRCNMTVPALAVLAMLMAWASPAWADEYTAWTKNAEQNRWECQYKYTTKDGGTASQTVLVYPKDSPRAGWAYFANDEGKSWGRCAIQGNPKYDAKQMYWQKLNTDKTGYENYPEAGFCPAPADGKKPIPKIPDPPV